MFHQLSPRKMFQRPLRMVRLRFNYYRVQRVGGTLLRSDVVGDERREGGNIVYRRGG